MGAWWPAFHGSLHAFAATPWLALLHSIGVAVWLAIRTGKCQDHCCNCLCASTLSKRLFRIPGIVYLFSKESVCEQSNAWLKICYRARDYTAAYPELFCTPVSHLLVALGGGERTVFPSGLL